ncbi:MAG: hypothetical protein AAFS10_23540 [Myxococcota bacterium]
MWETVQEKFTSRKFVTALIGATAALVLLVLGFLDQWAFIVLFSGSLGLYQVTNAATHWAYASRDTDPPPPLPQLGALDVSLPVVVSSDDDKG